MKIRYTGFHGTDPAQATVIDTEGLSPSSALHWLADGYYYYDDFYSAASWGGNQSVVYTSLLEAEADRVLDTLSKAGKELLLRIWNWLDSEDSPKRPVLRANQDPLAYALLEVLRNHDLGLRDEFDMIRAIYNKSAPLQNSFNMSLLESAEIHICVKKVECIKSFERVN